MFSAPSEANFWYLNKMFMSVLLPSVKQILHFGSLVFLEYLPALLMLCSRTSCELTKCFLAGHETQLY